MYMYVYLTKIFYTIPSMTNFLGRCLEVMTLREEETFLM